MAQVTVELRKLVEQTNFRLFDFDYVFDDKMYKKQLEQNVLDFYYDYEIGFETPDMFKRKFRAKWVKMMPYYNALYNTTLLSYNPLINYSVEEALNQLSKTSSKTDNEQSGTNTSKVKTEGSSQTNDVTESSSTSDTMGKSSDYPQQSIAGGDYLSGASETNTTGTNDSETNSSSTALNTSDSNDNSTTRGKASSEGESTSNYQKTVEGITGTTYPALIKQHREAMLRINDMVIDELKSCFILVY